MLDNVSMQTCLICAVVFIIIEEMCKVQLWGSACMTALVRVNGRINVISNYLYMPTKGCISVYRIEC